MKKSRIRGFLRCGAVILSALSQPWARVRFRPIEDATMKHVIWILSGLCILVNGPGEARADYMQTILSDMPAVYYRLGEPSGSTAFDSSGNHRDGSYLGGVSLGQPGALVGDPNTSVKFNGSTGIVDTNYKQVDLSFTFEAWINPTAALAKQWVIAGRGSSTRANASKSKQKARVAFREWYRSKRLGVVSSRYRRRSTHSAGAGTGPSGAAGPGWRRHCPCGRGCGLRRSTYPIPSAVHSQFPSGRESLGRSFSPAGTHC